MNGWDIILLLLLAGAAALAVRRIRANRRKGAGCSGHCAGCTLDCAHREENEKP